MTREDVTQKEGAGGLRRGTGGGFGFDPLGQIIYRHQAILMAASRDREVANHISTVEVEGLVRGWHIMAKMSFEARVTFTF